MNRPRQEIRDGGRTIGRTVHRISETHESGQVESGYVRHATKWFVVRKTKPMTWWKLVRPARPDDFRGTRRTSVSRVSGTRIGEFELGRGDYSSERHQWLDEQSIESFVDELMQNRNPEPRS